ncbi:MAG: hypothetical protein RRE78_06480 [Acidianus sp.]|jgi:phosphatidylglycerophosphate synthase|nr:hypothetical protein [Acidianus sp.]
MIVQKTKKSKKGISGAITALILVIASVIIALIVVAFAFGIIGGVSSSGQVKAIGTATLYTNGVLKVDLENTGATTQVTGVLFNGVTATAYNGTISAGTNIYYISISCASITNSLKGMVGSTVTLTLELSNGQSVTVSAVVES